MNDDEKLHQASLEAQMILLRLGGERGVLELGRSVWTEGWTVKQRGRAEAVHLSSLGKSR